MCIYIFAYVRIHTYIHTHTHTHTHVLYTNTHISKPHLNPQTTVLQGTWKFFFLWRVKETRGKNGFCEFLVKMFDQGSGSSS